MMITYKVIDTLEFFAHESTQELIDAYVAEGKKVNPLDSDPDMDFYKHIHKLPNTSLVAAYHKNKIVGYMFAITSPVPHYNVLGTTIDSIFIYEEYRSGGTARIMLDILSKDAKMYGSKHLFMSAPLKSVLHRVAPSLGFTKITSVFMKELD